MSDLAQLMSQDPLTFTKEGGEVEKIVAAFRERRTQFNLAAASPVKKAAAPKTASAKAAASLSGSGLSLNLQSILGKKAGS
jgi:hypothetical protein